MHHQLRLRRSWGRAARTVRAFVEEALPAPAGLGEDRPQTGPGGRQVHGKGRGEMNVYIYIYIILYIIYNNSFPSRYLCQCISKRLYVMPKQVLVRTNITVVVEKGHDRTDTNVASLSTP